MKIAVTGAFGYSGRYIARRLLDGGHSVITLTNSPARENPLGQAITAVGFNFDEPERLTKSLKGVEALINTYWVRFDYATFTHRQAVVNSGALFRAARDAGVGRIVHVSITNPDINSDLGYFRGKAQVELALEASGISHCILRPAVLFGKEDILINNIAWSLRHLPVFAVFGSGEYRLQPIHVDDLAAVAVARATTPGANEIVNAIGPETFTYRQMVKLIKATLGLRRLLVGVPPWAGYWGTRALGRIMHDVIITREEIRGLMEGRLYVDAPPLGTTKLSQWIEKHKEILGRRYTSEMARRVDRVVGYQCN